MGTTNTSCMLQVGETAGLVWHLLDQKGEMSLAKLAKEIKAPRDLIMQGVGWLAREGKIDITEKGRRKIIALR